MRFGSLTGAAPVSRDAKINVEYLSTLPGDATNGPLDLDRCEVQNAVVWRENRDVQVEFEFGWTPARSGELGGVL